LTAASPANRFAQDASLFPQCLDTAFDRVLLTRIDEQELRQASFLDQRIMSNQRWRQWVPWQELQAASGQPQASRDFIFHIGHVGSTLVSRLLGELDDVLALREPQLLRDFSDLNAVRGSPESPWPPEIFEPRLELALGWLSRGFNAGQRALIKTTSFVSEIAGAMLRPGGRALFLYVPPARYIESILAGDNSRTELAMMARSRLVRLHRRCGGPHWNLWELAEAERAAMSWACEMTALEHAAASLPEDRVLWLDFDVFLGNPGERLREIAGHFGHELDPGQANDLVQGPIMQRYSKAPEYSFSPQAREQVLAGAREQRRADIARALGWLNEAGRRARMIRKTLTRAAGQSDVHADTQSP
jgi:hypothetical protein